MKVENLVDLNMVQKKNKILLELISKINQKNGLKLKFYNNLKKILIKINEKFNLNQFYFLEKSIFNLLLSFSFKIIYINNIKYKIPIFISTFKSIKKSIKTLFYKNNFYFNIIDSFNFNYNIIKIKINSIKESYKNKIFLNSINIYKLNKINIKNNKINLNFKFNKIILFYNNYYIIN